MLMVYQNIVLIAINLFNQLCKVVVEIDQLLLLKWMLHQVELIQLFWFNLNKDKCFKEKKDKNYQLFI
jgi:hypothetical protein